MPIREACARCAHSVLRDAGAVLLVALGGLLSVVVGCSDEILDDPIVVCRCRPDEVCVDGRCVQLGDATLLDAPSGTRLCEPADGIRISELRYAGVSRPDFVELAGPPGTSLEGWFLRSFEADGSRRGLVQLSGRLAADDGLWVAAFGSGLEAAPDLDYGTLGSALGLAAPSGSLELLDCQGRRVDAVAWGPFGEGEQARGEGQPAPPSAADGALARCPSGGTDEPFAVVDTDDNARDFHPVIAPTPGAANAACVPCEADALAGALWIAEVLYDPPGADSEAAAFVELRGTAGAALEGVTLERWDEDQQRFTVLGALTGSVSEEGFYLIAEAGHEDEQAQLLLDGLDADNVAGGFRLVACGETVLDVVGWGELASPEALGLSSDAVGSDVPDGSSLGRCPDDEAGGALIELGLPTPGAANGCT